MSTVVTRRHACTSFIPPEDQVPHTLCYHCPYRLSALSPQQISEAMAIIDAWAMRGGSVGRSGGVDAGVEVGQSCGRCVGR